MLYALHCISLFLFVYMAPALALYPQAISHPGLLASVPVLSALVLYCTTITLLMLGSFTIYVVPVISSLFAAVACYRIRHYLQHNTIQWPENTGKWFLLNAILVFPYAVKLGMTGFDSGDEIYSWNVWALQYVQGMLHPDMINVTNAPYPQLFPKFLAYGYQWLGDTQLQLPLKAMLVLFSYSMLCAISFVCPKQKPALLWATFSVLLLMIYGTGLQRYFDNAYADPLMIAAIINALALYCHFSKQKENTHFLWGAVFCAIAGAYSKQPGLVLAGFSLPAMLLLSNQKWARAERGIAILLLLASTAYWLFGEGSGFHDNGGVLHASFQGRGVMEQLAFSINKYWWHNPVIFLGFVGAIASTHHAKKYRSVVWLWLIPNTFLWFLYGSYDLRLGVHVLAGSFLLCVATGFSGGQRLLGHEKWGRISTAMQHRFVPLSGGLAILTLAVSGYLLQNSYVFGKTNYSPYNSGPIVLAKYFGQDTDWIVENLYDRQDVYLWTATDYIFGLFYEKTPIVRPNYAIFDVLSSSGVNEYTKNIFIEEMRVVQPDYLFNVGRLPVRGAFVALLLDAVHKDYPEAFEVVASPPNRYGITTYQLHPEHLPPIKDLAQLATSG